MLETHEERTCFVATMMQASGKSDSFLLNLQSSSNFVSPAAGHRHLESPELDRSELFFLRAEGLWPDVKPLELAL